VRLCVFVCVCVCVNDCVHACMCMIRVYMCVFARMSEQVRQNDDVYLHDDTRRLLYKHYNPRLVSKFACCQIACLALYFDVLAQISLEVVNVDQLITNRTADTRNHEFVCTCKYTIYIMDICIYICMYMYINAS